MANDFTRDASRSQGRRGRSSQQAYDATLDNLGRERGQDGRELMSSMENAGVSAEMVSQAFAEANGDMTIFADILRKLTALIKESAKEADAQMKATQKSLEEARKFRQAGVDSLADASLAQAKNNAQRALASSSLSGGQKERYERRIANAGSEVELQEIVRKLEQLNEKYAQAAEKAENSKVLKDIQTKFGNFTDEMSDRDKAILGGIAELVDGFNDLVASGVQEAKNMLESHLARINTRLEGSEKSYNSMSKLVTDNLAVSPFVKQQTVMENIAKLVDKGIAYNTEERAYLLAAADNIVTTFDDNFNRMILLQQKDSTEARIGLESSLNTLFNEYFSDTSYLSDQFDSVQQALYEASGRLTNEQATEFEYTVQKWLGSLYSVGASSGFISSLSGALGNLGSGNVNALSGSAMQNLLALAANRSGLDYAELLTNGLYANNTNTLLATMVRYLADIAESTKDNNVVAQAYAETFGIAASDLRAAANLAASLNDISGTGISYDQMRGLTSNRLSFSSLAPKYTASQMLSNVLGNVQYTLGNNIVSNPLTFALWEAADALENFSVPSIMAMGSGITDLGTIGSLMKTGLGVVSAIGSFGSAVNSLGNVFGGDLSSWNARESIQRGSGYLLNTSSGTTGSAYRGSGSTSDQEEEMYSSAYSDAKDNTRKMTGEETSELKFDDLYYALVNEDTTAILPSIDTNIHSMADEVTSLTTELKQIIKDGAINVNLATMGDVDATSGIPIYFSGNRDTGYNQLSNMFIALLSAFGIEIDQKQTYTLSDLITSIASQAEGNGINVNLANNEVSATSFLTGTSGYERY